MLLPMSGGLHDPALGGISALDANCTTCRMSSVHCAGHCGHIELPVSCYHPQYIDSTLRLLRSKCAYCHEFKAPAAEINLAICAIRLLQLGLVADAGRIQNMRPKPSKKQPSETDPDDVVEEILEKGEAIEDFIARRTVATKHAIKKARKAGKIDEQALIKNQVAIDARKAVIGHFLRNAPGFATCFKCGGAAVKYRKDKAVKIFRVPLSEKSVEKMRVEDKRAPNPLLFLRSERAQKADTKMINGVDGMHGSDEDSDAASQDQPEVHGAEQEIALQNAIETQAQHRTVEVGDDKKGAAYMTATEVHAALTLLFEREQKLLKLLYTPLPSQRRMRLTPDMFFMSAVLVPPNRYRPLVRQGKDQMMENQINSLQPITFAKCQKRAREPKQILTRDQGL
jgi:DNA-directed RNA polymerase I subunit RPA1